MTTQLSPTELQTAQSLLADYAAPQPAVTLLSQNNGSIETSLEELIAAEAGTAVYGADRKSLRDVFLRNL